MSLIKIYNSKPVQTDFWGNGAIFHGFAGMPDDAGRIYSEEQCELEAKRAADMRLKIARTFYGWYAWDEKTGEWNWENEKMQAFYRWLERLKKADIDVALNTGWCSPGDINSTAWNGKSPFTVKGDWKKSVQNYADWVSETVHQLIELRGFTNVKVLVLFTEPQYYSGTPDDKNQPTYDLWLDSATAVHKTLIRDGRRKLVSLMGPNEGSTSTSKMLKWAAENAGDIIDLYSSHNYQWIPAVSKEDIKSGKTSLTLMGKFARACRKISLKPNTDYTAVLDIKYSSDFKQTGGYVFGIYEYDKSGDIVTTGLLPALADESILTLATADIPREYSKFSVKFNSGNKTEALLGIFCGVNPPAELEGKTLALSEYKGMSAGIARIDSMEVFETKTGEKISENGDFSNYYDGWYLSDTAGGLPEPYYDWQKWVDTAMRYIPGDDNSKPYCFDEYNICYDRDNSRKTLGAELVSAAVSLMNSGVRCSMLWTLFDQQWPDNHTFNADSFIDGDHRCGLMPNLRFSEVPHSAYYAFSLLSRYVDGRGTAVYKGIGENGTEGTMSVSPDGEITIVTVNTNDCEAQFTLSFENSLGCSLKRHRFDPQTIVCDADAALIKADKTFNCINTVLCDSIAPYGVNIYTTHRD